MDIKTRSLSIVYKKKGLRGFINELKARSEHNIFIRILLVLDKRLFVISRLLKDLARLENGISKGGPGKQALKFLSKLRIKTAVYSDITNRDFNHQKGLLIYGINHSAIIEPIILFSLLKQRKIKLILFRMYCFAGKNIRKISLPVVARNYHDDTVINIKRLFDFSRSFRNSEKLSDSRLAMTNERSIKNAVRILETGGTVIIFPGGGGNELNKWKFGISRIILNISKKKRKDISILPVYFSGMGSRRMLVRIFKAYKNIRQGYLRVGVYFGKEKTVQDVYGSLGNKTTESSILRYLRKDAFSQYGLKEFPFRMYLYPKNYSLAFSRSLAFFLKIFIQIAPFKEFFKW